MTTSGTARTTALALVLMALLSGCSTTSSASCVAPTITVSPSTLAPGDDFTVSGEYFFDDCNDTGNGISSPARNIAVTITPLGATASPIILATIDADNEGKLTVTATVPDDQQAGTALVVVGLAMYVSVQITADGTAG